MATKRSKRIDPSDAFKAIVGQVDAPEAGAEAATPKATKQPNTPPKEQKLVQKGYYITGEQAKQLAMYAALNDLDKSSIVRQALDLFFETHSSDT